MKRTNKFSMALLVALLLTTAFCLAAVPANNAAPDSCNGCYGESINAAEAAGEECMNDGGSQQECDDAFMSGFQQHCFSSCSPCQFCADWMQIQKALRQWKDKKAATKSKEKGGELCL